jgi:DNA ligase (NAD+)
MDIHAAEATIDLLYREGLIRDPADLYTLEFDALVGLERFGEKSAMNLLESIEASREIPFPRVLYALGIRYVGETVARKLAHAFGNIDALMEADQEALVEVDEIGERIAQSVIAYFGNEAHREMTERLRQYGLRLTAAPEGQEVKQTLAGKSFVVSGVFASHSREEIKALIEQHGGRNTGSVSAKTDYLLAGENMGPSKREKAEKLGISIISEQEFLAMIS